MSVEESHAYFLGSDEGEAIWLLGGLYTFKALGDQNANQYTVVEVTGPGGPQGLAAPLHYHEREDEGFYVVEGEITLVIGDKTLEASAGSFAFAPRNTHHAFRLESPTAKMLLLITPGAAGHEGLFREMGDPADAPVVPPPPDAPPDLERLVAIGSRHGTRIIGPPPGTE